MQEGNQAGSSEADDGSPLLGAQGDFWEACYPLSIDSPIWADEIETDIWTSVQVPKAADAAHQLL